MDEVVKLIQQLLPQLSSELVEKTKDKLIEIGVGNVDDLQLVQEQDLSVVLKPIQIRKLVQHFIAVKNPVSKVLKSSPACKDNSITTPGKDESLVDSPSSGRSTPLLFGDTDTPSDGDENNTSKSAPKAHNYWINSFKIPWDKFPKSLLDACNKKVRPKPRDRREMIRIICDNIKEYTSLPGRKNLSRIAEAMVAKYKDSFCDVIGDAVIGSGHESLLKQLEERIANLNRKGDKAAVKLNVSSDDDDPETKGKKRKRVLHDSYGCINWQPDSLSSDETSASQKSKQEWLVAEFPKKDVDRKKVLLFMEKTYTSQRLLINNDDPNNPVSIKEIQIQWPFLFDKECMFLHFEQLMGFIIQDVMQESMQAKASTIFEFMKKKYDQKMKVRKTVWRIEAAMSLEKSKLPQMTGVFLLLLAYFGERPELMFKSDLDETVNIEDIVKLNCPASPFLAVFGETLLAKRCCLVVDGVVVNESLTDIQEGIMVLFATYYVLNIAYPEELAATLEFIQRCFLHLNPEKGSKRVKTKGKKHIINPKVLTLANQLRDYQSEWTL